MPSFSSHTHHHVLQYASFCAPFRTRGNPKIQQHVPSYLVPLCLGVLCRDRLSTSSEWREIVWRSMRWWISGLSVVHGGPSWTSAASAVASERWQPSSEAHWGVGRRAGEQAAAWSPTPSTSIAQAGPKTVEHASHTATGCRPPSRGVLGRRSTRHACAAASKLQLSLD